MIWEVHTKCFITGRPLNTCLVALLYCLILPEGVPNQRCYRGLFNERASVPEQGESANQATQHRCLPVGQLAFDRADNSAALQRRNSSDTPGSQPAPN